MKRERAIRRTMRAMEGGAGASPTTTRLMMMMMMMMMMNSITRAMMTENGEDGRRCRVRTVDLRIVMMVVVRRIPMAPGRRRRR